MGFAVAAPALVVVVDGACALSAPSAAAKGCPLDAFFGDLGFAAAVLALLAVMDGAHAWSGSSAANKVRPLDALGGLGFAAAALAPVIVMDGAGGAAALSVAAKGRVLDALDSLGSRALSSSAAKDCPLTALRHQLQHRCTVNASRAQEQSQATKSPSGDRASKLKN